MIGWLITNEYGITQILKTQKSAKEELKTPKDIYEEGYTTGFIAEAVDEKLTKSIIGLFCIGAEDKVNEMYEKSKKTPIKIMF